MRGAAVVRLARRVRGVFERVARREQYPRSARPTWRSRLP